MKIIELSEFDKEHLRGLSRDLTKRYRTKSLERYASEWDVRQFPLILDSEIPDNIKENPLLAGYIDRKRYGLLNELLEIKISSQLEKQREELSISRLIGEDNESIRFFAYVLGFTLVDNSHNVANIEKILFDLVHKKKKSQEMLDYF